MEDASDGTSWKYQYRPHFCTHILHASPVVIIGRHRDGFAQGSIRPRLDELKAADESCIYTYNTSSKCIQNWTIKHAEVGHSSFTRHQLCETCCRRRCRSGASEKSKVSGWSWLRLTII